MIRRLAEARVFFRQFRTQFHTTGAVLPSSRFLGRAMARPLTQLVQDHPDRPIQILEAGPGTGALTQALFGYLRPDDRLRLVELNSDFVAQLKQRCEKDPAWKNVKSQLDIREGSVDNAELVPAEHFDLVVCGLPFNNFSPELVEKLLGHLVQAIRPGGQLTFFEYFGIRPVKKVFVRKAERQRLTQVGQMMEDIVGPLRLGYRRVWRNVPPAVVHHLQKPASKAEAG